MEFSLEVQCDSLAIAVAYCSIGRQGITKRVESCSACEILKPFDPIIIKLAAKMFDFLSVAALGFPATQSYRYTGFDME